VPEESICPRTRQAIAFVERSHGAGSIDIGALGRAHFIEGLLGGRCRVLLGVEQVDHLWSLAAIPAAVDNPECGTYVSPDQRSRGRIS